MDDHISIHHLAEEWVVPGGLKMYTGGSLNTVQPVTRRDRGEPHPQGGDSPSMRCHGGMRRSAVRCDHLTEIPFLLPVHSIRLNHQTLARCREGGGGGRFLTSKDGIQERGSVSAPRPPSRRNPHRWTAPWFACSTVLAYLPSTPAILRSGGFQPFCRSFSVCGSRQRSSRFS